MKKKNLPGRSRPILLSGVFLFLAAAILTGAASAYAFTGPGQLAPGTGAGAFGSNSTNDISAGTSTATSGTKFLIVASSSNTTSYGLRIQNAAGTPLLFVRADGSIGIATSSFGAGIGATVGGSVSISGNLTATISPANLSTGVFGGAGSGANFAVPGNLGVGTSSQVGLPATLTSYGDVQIGGAIGASQGFKLGQGVYPWDGYWYYTDDGTGYGPGWIHKNTTSGNTEPTLWLVASAGDSANLRVNNAITLGNMNLAAMGSYPTVSSTISLNGAPSGNSYFNTGGNVGIGTTNPGSLLEVGGNIVASSSGATLVKVAGQGTVGWQVQDYTNGNQYQDFAGSLFFRAGIDGAGGINPLTLASSGLVGVATTAPAYALDVNGTLRATTILGAVNGVVSAGNVSAGTFGSNTGGGTYYFPAAVNTQMGGVTVGQFGGDSNGDLELGPIATSTGNTPFIDFHYGAGTLQDYNIRLINVANNRLDVNNSSGATLGSFVGNGFAVATTTTGSYSLNVGSASGQLANFQSAANSFIDVQSVGASGNAITRYFNPGGNWMVGIDGSDSNKFKILTGLSSVFSGSNGLVISSAGNVSIGTTTIGAKLYVNGGGWPGASNPANSSAYGIAAPNIGADVSIYSYGAICTGNGVGNCSGSSGVVLGNNNTSATVNIPNSGVTFFNGGNVGIGTTAPGQPLQVGSGGTYTQNAFIRFGAGNGAGVGREWDIGVPYGSATVTAPYYGFIIKDVNAGVNRLVIDWNTGNVGISTSSPAYALDVNGTIRGTTLLGTYSGSVAAGNISAGNFGANTGGGNYGFTANVQIGGASSGFYPLTINAPSGGGGITWQKASTTKWDTYVGSDDGFYISDDTRNIIVVQRGAPTTSIAVFSGGTVGVGGNNQSTAVAMLDVGTTVSCCAPAAPTLGISELTASNNRLPWIQFHSSGYQEAFIRLASTSRTLEIGDNQGQSAALGFRNAANTLVGLKLNQSGSGNISFEINSDNRTKGIYWKADGDSSYGGIYRDTATGQLRIDDQSNGLILNGANGQNVGIGTTTAPTAKLQVAQDVSSYPTTGVYGQIEAVGATNSAYRLALGYNTTANAGFIQAVQSSVAYRDLLLQPSGANVGIGVTATAEVLDIASPAFSNPKLRFEFSASSTSAIIGLGGNYLGTGNASDGNLVFRDDVANASMMWGFNGSTKMFLTNGGNLGIGTTTPQALLSVGGTTTSTVAIFGGGQGKITVGTVDPLYTINGDKFATYLPGMTGQKEETTGVAKLSGEKAYVIDFASQEKGSDLWLFAQTTDLKDNFENMTVLLTPSFDGKAWYEKDAKRMTLTIHGSAAGEVSYRFTAPRFDAASWTNVSHDSGAGLIINN